MKRLAATFASLSLLTAAPSDIVQAQAPAGDGQTLRITRAGSQPSAKGSAQYFTGAVRVDPMFPATAPSRVSGGHVTFEPGARSAWHTHPVGQTLIITSGLGFVQQWGGPKQDVRAGDVVWFPPGIKHWHGASAITAMTHIAI
jgi:quercetin dioxygenase-like cupin family protein